MNQLSAVDIEAFKYLLLANFIVSAFIGFVLAWYLRGQYDFNRWLKRGIYCDDCAPLVGLPKKPVGYSYDCLNTSDCLCLKCFEALSNANNK